MSILRPKYSAQRLDRSWQGNGNIPDGRAGRSNEQWAADKSRENAFMDTVRLRRERVASPLTPARTFTVAAQPPAVDPRRPPNLAPTDIREQNRYLDEAGPRRKPAPTPQPAPVVTNVPPPAGGGVPQARPTPFATGTRGTAAPTVPQINTIQHANLARLLARNSVGFKGRVGGGVFSDDASANTFLKRNPRLAAAALNLPAARDPKQLATVTPTTGRRRV